MKGSAASFIDTHGRSAPLGCVHQAQFEVKVKEAQARLEGLFEAVVVVELVEDPGGDGGERVGVEHGLGSDEHVGDLRGVVLASPHHHVQAGVVDGEQGEARHAPGEDVDARPASQAGPAAYLLGGGEADAQDGAQLVDAEICECAEINKAAGAGNTFL